mmetsp:Transcript_80832/g.142566  ORF Transcript_80832/g.142566 Transcript_80832/m.142566 type:complete len:354 (-) Transcript_80832:56-1117(-)
MNSARAMLDALMGPQRDAGRKGKKDDDWKDKSVCKQYLVGCCPFDKDMLGGVSKLDLRACTKIHSELIRNRFLEHADGREDSELRTEYEQDMLRDMEEALQEREKFRQREKERMRTDPRFNTVLPEDKQKIEKLREDSDINMKKAKELEAMAMPYGGNNFNSIMAELYRTARDLSDEADNLNRQALKRAAGMLDPQTCDVCGTGYMTKAEYDKHLNGRVHEGYTQVQDAHEKLKQKGTGKRPGRADKSRSRDDKPPPARDGDDMRSAGEKRGRADDYDDRSRSRGRGKGRDARRDDSGRRPEKGGRPQKEPQREERGRRSRYDEYDDEPPRRSRRPAYDDDDMMLPPPRRSRR